MFCDGSILIWILTSSDVDVVLKNQTTVAAAAVVVALTHFGSDKTPF